MATDDVVAPEKSALRELLALLFSPGVSQTAVPELQEIKEILELGEPKPRNETRVKQTALNPE
jgi:hypothetical protein